MSPASVGDDWEPPAHWESDIIADVMGPPPWWVVVAFLFVWVGAVGWAVLRADGGGGAMDFWEPGSPESAVVVSWHSPTFGERLWARVRRQPEPTTTRHVSQRDAHR